MTSVKIYLALFCYLAIMYTHYFVLKIAKQKFGDSKKFMLVDAGLIMLFTCIIYLPYIAFFEGVNVNHITQMYLTFIVILAISFISGCAVYTKSKSLKFAKAFLASYIISVLLVKFVEYTFNVVFS